MPTTEVGVISEEERGRRDRAIAVARDVLKQLAREDVPLNLAPGAYLDSEDRIVMDHGYIGDLQPIVDQVQAQCEVCLLGACLLSKARLYDAVPIDRVWSSRYIGGANFETISEVLGDIFSPDQMRLMEAAFERDCELGPCEGDDLRGLRRGANAFGNRAVGHVGDADAEANARVVKAVMENVVANDGLFVVAPMSGIEYFREFMTYAFWINEEEVDEDDDGIGADEEDEDEDS